MKNKFRKLIDVNPKDHTPIIESGLNEPNVYIYKSEDCHEKVYGSDIPFMLVRFPDIIHGSNMYLKWCDNPYFLQLPHVGNNSGMGNVYGECEDPYCKYESTYYFHICGEDAFVKKSFGLGAFLKRSCDITEIENEYYLEMPDFYSCEYIFDISGVKLYKDYPYLIIARPVYNYTYEKLKCFFVNPDGRNIELEIDGVSRARDGGTTMIKTKFNDYGEIPPINIFCETPFKGENRKITVDDQDVKLIKGDDNLNRLLIETVLLKPKTSLYIKE